LARHLTFGHSATLVAIRELEPRNGRARPACHRGNLQLQSKTIGHGQGLESGSAEERERVYAERMPWWGRLGSEGKLGAAHQLQPPETPTTVVIDHGRSMLLHGPLMR
jgi:hypothetical protein